MKKLIAITILLALTGCNTMNLEKRMDRMESIHEGFLPPLDVTFSEAKQSWESSPTENK